MGNLFYEFALLLAVAGIMGLLAYWLKQPLIVAFIIIGILFGPTGLKWVTIGSEIDLLAKMGIALLLFTVGLKLDLHVIRSLGPVSLATGLGQVIFTSAIGYFLCLALGLSNLSSLYVSVALTFSSTIIIVKLLSDKREIDSLHGRIAVGFLIVQDMIVVLAMIAITAFGAGTRGGSLGRSMLMIALKGTLFLGLVALFMRFVLPYVFHLAAQSSELLIVLAIAWAVALAAAGDFLGFSKEIGAFLAGVSLASTPYREALISRLSSLRDFLLLFFFIDLGAYLKLTMIRSQIFPALGLSLFVLIGNPFIVMVIMGVMGFRKRTGFLAGLTVAQISEFSLMLGALGRRLGHIPSDVMGLITLVGLITIGLSTYMILYSHLLYARLAPWLGIFERRVPCRETAQEEPPPLKGVTDAIIFGMGRFGSNIARELSDRGVRILGVDFDPELIRRSRKAKQAVVYGDAEDPDLPSILPLSKTRWIVSSLPQISVNLCLLHALKTYAYEGKTAFTAHNDRDAELLKKAGVDLVLLPFMEAAKEAAKEILQEVSGDD